MLDESVGRTFAPPTRSDVPTERTGYNSIERKAVFRVQRDIAAMPASLVVQLALWPDHVAAWARSEGSSESLVYNMLARRKPYLRMRERLARRLDVGPAVLSHLIDAARPLPSSKRPPPLTDSPAERDEPPPIDWTMPPFPLYRDGSNPLERRAARRVEIEIASMPASTVVGLALWPDTLASWAREQGVRESVVSATLAGSPGDRVRAALARRLDVSQRDLDALIVAARRAPRASVPPDPPPQPAPAAEAPASAGQSSSREEDDERAADGPDRAQTSLEL